MNLKNWHFLQVRCTGQVGSMGAAAIAEIGSKKRIFIMDIKNSYLYEQSLYVLRPEWLEEVQKLDEAQLVSFLRSIDLVQGVVLANTKEVIDVSTPQ
jgi:hypothetical protein